MHGRGVADPRDINFYGQHSSASTSDSKRGASGGPNPSPASAQRMPAPDLSSRTRTRVHLSSALTAANLPICDALLTAAESYFAADAHRPFAISSSDDGDGASSPSFFFSSAAPEVIKVISSWKIKHGGAAHDGSSNKYSPPRYEWCDDAYPATLAQYLRWAKFTPPPPMPQQQHMNSVDEEGAGGRAAAEKYAHLVADAAAAAERAVSAETMAGTLLAHIELSGCDRSTATASGAPYSASHATSSASASAGGGDPQYGRRHYRYGDGGEAGVGASWGCGSASGGGPSSSSVSPAAAFRFGYASARSDPTAVYASGGGGAGGGAANDNTADGSTFSQAFPWTADEQHAAAVLGLRLFRAVADACVRGGGGEGGAWEGAEDDEEEEGGDDGEGERGSERCDNESAECSNANSATSCTNKNGASKPPERPHRSRTTETNSSLDYHSYAPSVGGGAVAFSMTIPLGGGGGSATKAADPVNVRRQHLDNGDYATSKCDADDDDVREAKTNATDFGFEEHDELASIPIVTVWNGMPSATMVTNRSNNGEEGDEAPPRGSGYRAFMGSSSSGGAYSTALLAAEARRLRAGMQSVSRTFTLVRELWLLLDNCVLPSLLFSTPLPPPLNSYAWSGIKGYGGGGKASASPSITPLCADPWLVLCPKSAIAPSPPLEADARPLPSLPFPLPPPQMARRRCLLCDASEGSNDAFGSCNSSDDSQIHQQQQLTEQQRRMLAVATRFSAEELRASLFDWCGVSSVRSSREEGGEGAVPSGSDTRANGARAAIEAVMAISVCCADDDESREMREGKGLTKCPNDDTSRLRMDFLHHCFHGALKPPSERFEDDVRPLFTETFTRCGTSSSSGMNAASGGNGNGSDGWTSFSVGPGPAPYHASAGKGLFPFIHLLQRQLTSAWGGAGAVVSTEAVLADIFRSTCFPSSATCSAATNNTTPPAPAPPLRLVVAGPPLLHVVTSAVAGQLPQHYVPRLLTDLASSSVCSSSRGHGEPQEAEREDEEGSNAPISRWLKVATITPLRSWGLPTAEPALDALTSHHLSEATLQLQQLLTARHHRLQQETSSSSPSTVSPTYSPIVVAPIVDLVLVAGPVAAEHIMYVHDYNERLRAMAHRIWREEEEDEEENAEASESALAKADEAEAMALLGDEFYSPNAQKRLSAEREMLRRRLGVLRLQWEEQQEAEEEATNRASRRPRLSPHAIAPYGGVVLVAGVGAALLARLTTDSYGPTVLPNPNGRLMALTVPARRVHVRQTEHATLQSNNSGSSVGANTNNKEEGQVRTSTAAEHRQYPRIIHRRRLMESMGLFHDGARSGDEGHARGGAEPQWVGHSNDFVAVMSLPSVLSAALPSSASPRNVAGEEHEEEENKRRRSDPMAHLFAGTVGVDDIAAAAATGGTAAKANDVRARQSFIITLMPLMVTRTNADRASSEKEHVATSCSTHSSSSSSPSSAFVGRLPHTPSAPFNNIRATVLNGAVLGPTLSLFESSFWSTVAALSRLFGVLYEHSYEAARARGIAERSARLKQHHSRCSIFAALASAQQKKRQSEGSNSGSDHISSINHPLFAPVVCVPCRRVGDEERRWERRFYLQFTGGAGAPAAASGGASFGQGLKAVAAIRILEAVESAAGEQLIAISDAQRLRKNKKNQHGQGGGRKPEGKASIDKKAIGIAEGGEEGAAAATKTMKTTPPRRSTDSAVADRLAHIITAASALRNALESFSALTMRLANVPHYGSQTVIPPHHPMSHPKEGEGEGEEESAPSTNGTSSSLPSVAFAEASPMPEEEVAQRRLLWARAAIEEIFEERSQEESGAPVEKKEAERMRHTPFHSVLLLSAQHVVIRTPAALASAMAAVAPPLHHSLAAAASAESFNSSVQRRYLCGSNRIVSHLPSPSPPPQPLTIYDPLTDVPRSVYVADGRPSDWGVLAVPSPMAASWGAESVADGVPPSLRGAAESMRVAALSLAGAAERRDGKNIAVLMLEMLTAEADLLGHQHAMLRGGGSRRKCGSQALFAAPSGLLSLVLEPSQALGDSAMAKAAVLIAASLGATLCVSFQ